MSISTAIGLERLSRISGYKISKGFFDNDTPNLPQVIAIFGEANTANQAVLSLVKKEITSADEAGKVYGYGSPIHQIMRILRPNGSEGVGGIPTIVFPQLAAVGATATIHEWTVTGAATKNSTHSAVIAGRENLDFVPYSYSVVIGDTPAVIAGKISDAINGVLNSPVMASSALGVVTLTTKWKGSTSAALNTSFNTNDEAAGITYAKTASTDGAGAVSLAGALDQFGNDWNTLVINPYGEDVLDVLEQFNGFPSEIPTGRWVGQTFMPFMAFFGSVLSDKDELTAITDAEARKEQLTNVLCPAPNSPAFPWEAAANVVRLFARTMQDTPHLDVNGYSYPDMPTPSNGIIGDMSNYNNRDFLIKKGCSNVILDKGSYKIQDLVTTYHPAGETPFQYAYCRNINLDWNFSFAYRILENLYVKDRVLVRDDQTTEASKSIKPVEWKAIIFELIDLMALRALINEPAFSKKSVRVQVSPLNHDRIETSLKYKRTGVARIESTDVEAGF